jgi:hypothetical protein
VCFVLGGRSFIFLPPYFYFKEGVYMQDKLLAIALIVAFLGFIYWQETKKFKKTGKKGRLMRLVEEIKELKK